jgi:putative Mg2+ transporter-C (MgtC) family protein
MAFFDPVQFIILLKLVVSAIIGGLLGAERTLIGKPIGIRTFALVAMGATLFTVLAQAGFQFFNTNPGLQYEPYRVIGQMVVAIGFLAAGVIIFREKHLEGLTTAAGLWVTAAIGVAIGLELYLAALGAALIVFIILFLIWYFEIWLERRFGIETHQEGFRKKPGRFNFLRRFKQE